ncbi:DUF3916 domain-containing protein [Bacillus sp. FJAT-27445]|uniref:DUF3916 domain-containing protein n=1 Tax=Bacillus sp. FJAT-27445 TaxID=1679166 RepID=UPI000743EB68|nr:DUF3916 domain-containing protein [Bacillus sp. FJAT-27445]
MNSKKKVRGKRRKIRRFIRLLNEATKDFPEDFSYGYWEIHLPDRGSFWINSPKTPTSVRRLCIQALINRTKFLIDIKPSQYQTVKVLLIINFHYWHSAKIEFYIPKTPCEGIYPFTEDEYIRIVPLNKNRDFAAEWGLEIPMGLEIMGLKEEIKDLELVDDTCFGGEIWYLGELS